MPFPYRKSLFVLLGVAACRARDAAPPVQAQVHFQIAPMGAPDLRAIAAIQNHFWITTSAGVVVIDPVAETWSTVFVDSAPVGEVEVIPCGSHVWLLRHDTLIVIDVETQRMEIRAARPGTQDPRPSLIASRCGMGALWTYDRMNLFHIPVSHDSTKRYEIPSFGERTFGRDFVDALPGGVQFLITDPQAPAQTRLVHFDTATARFETVDLPPGGGVFTMERADDGVLLRMYDQRRYVLKGRGQPWVEVPRMQDSAGPVLARQNGIVWVGASYDVSPSSYFVLRYIRDAAEPQDLLVLPDFYTNIRSAHRSAVQHLGMLWVVSGPNLLRIDPAAEEVVRYRPNPDGTLAKSAFKFSRGEGGQLRYFDGDSLRSLPGIAPVAPDTTAPSDSTTANLREKPEGERSLDRDLLAVQLQVLLRLREIQYPDELGLGPAFVPLGHEDLSQCERRRHMLRKGVADELEGRNRARVVAAPGEDLSF
jgi:hypothetical protein